MAFQGYWLHNEPQAEGGYFAHTEWCEYLPPLESRTPLGLHADCQSALVQARILHENMSGCPHCTSSCNTGETQLDGNPYSDPLIS